LSAIAPDAVGGRRPRWGLGEVLLGLLVAVVASSIVGAIALGATGDDDFDELPMWLYSIVQAGQYVGFVGVPLLFTRVKGNGPVLDLGARLQARDVPIGIALGVGLQLIVVPLISLPGVWLLGKDANELDDRARDLTDRAHGFGLLMLTLVVVVGAPLAEELFFRGLTLRAFERRLGARWALIATSVLFAATHLDLLSFPALVAFGLVAGWLAQRTGRLGLSWCTHLGFNATTIAILVATR
jgi:membrane protease YdiL (CAAX protease family)